MRLTESEIQIICNAAHVFYGDECNVYLFGSRTSDDPKRLGDPRGFTLKIREIRLSVGAGFAVAIAGPIMTMPGLSKDPAAYHIDVDKQGKISGLF